MRYIISFVKVMLLVTLILTSIYQTSELWFESSSDRNFFYRVFRDNSLPQSDVELYSGNLVSVQRLGVFLGKSDIEHTIIGSGEQAYEEILEAMRSVIAESFLSGTYMGTLENDEVLWETPHFLLIPSIELNKKILKENFVVKTDISDLSSVASFIIAPSDGDKNSIHLYIESADTLEVYHYVLKIEEVQIDNILLSSHLQEISNRANNPTYISSRKNRLIYFESTNLIPTLNRDIRYHSNIFLQIPFIKRGEIDNEALSEYVDDFFDNPEVVSQNETSNTVQFSDTKSIVKYDQSGMIEFISLASKGGTNTSLVLAKAISTKFIEQTNYDSAIDTVFSKYFYNEDGSISMVYDYEYNGYPIVMSSVTEGTYGIHGGIEVVVLGEEVISAKMLLRELDDLLPQDGILRKPYIAALDDYISMNGPLDRPIEKMYLGYEWQSDNQEMSLNWVLEIGGQRYYVTLDER